MGFDINSIMTYDKDAFSKDGSETVSWLFSDLPTGEEWFYMLSEISTAHDCQGTYCRWR